MPSSTASSAEELACSLSKKITDLLISHSYCFCIKMWLYWLQLPSPQVSSKMHIMGQREIRQTGSSGYPCCWNWLEEECYLKTPSFWVVWVWGFFAFLMYLSSGQCQLLVIDNISFLVLLIFSYFLFCLIYLMLQDVKGKNFFQHTGSSSLEPT